MFKNTIPYFIFFVLSYWGNAKPLLAQMPAPKLKDPLHYEYPSELQPVFEDNFDDDRNNWLDPSGPEDHENMECSIKGGYFSIRNSKNVPWQFGFPTNIDFTRDYELEISFRIDEYKRKSNYVALFIWAADSTKNSEGTSVHVSYSGAINFVSCYGGDHKQCKGKSIYSRPKDKKGFRTFTARKKNGRYYLFINNKFIKSIPDNKLRGREIGIGAYQNAAVTYDYIRIYYLD